MTDKYAVIGNPIIHSKSPVIHAEFAKQTSQEMTYEAILAPMGGFADTIKHLVDEGYKGANVTVPFKLDAYHLINQSSMEGVHGAEAVNTLTFEDGLIKGANTDGVGLVTDIQKNLGILLKGKRVLLIGAGGAAQGVAHEVVKKAPAIFVVANRTMEKVYAMKRKMEDSEVIPVTSIITSSFDNLEGQCFDVVINATSTGLSGGRLAIPDCVFASESLAYDMMYGRETPFMKQARGTGARVTDGLGMLVEQAAEAFKLWRGIRPDSKAVIDKMRV